MRIRCWVRAISSRCTELTSSSCSRASSRSVARTASSCCSRSWRACSTAARASAASSSERSSACQHDADARYRPPRPPGPRGSSRSRRSAARARASRSAWAARSSGRRGRAARGRAPRRCAAPAAPPSRPVRAVRAASTRRSRSSASGSSSGASSARGQPGLELGEPGQVLLAGLLGLGDGPLEPVGLAPGGAGLRAELAELLGHRGQRGVGLVQLGQRDVDPLLGVVPLALEPGHVERRAARSAADRLGQRGVRLVDRRLDLDQARLARTSRRRRSGPRAGRRRGSRR